MSDETKPPASDPTSPTAGGELVPTVSAVLSAPDPAVPLGGTLGAETTATRELTADERIRVDKIKETVDVTDPNMVVQYGLPAQSKIAAFADSLLADLRTKDADAAGVAITELLSKVRELDVGGLTKGSKG